MSISDISAKQVLLNLNGTRTSVDKLAAQHTSSTGRETPSADQEGWAVIARDSAEYGKQEAIKESANQTAVGIRRTDQALQRLGWTVGQMKQTVEAIVKNYPPYPPGSEDRVRALKQYAGLRETIAELTVPPDTSSQTAAASATISEGNWIDVVGSDGLLRTVSKSETRVGPSGLVVQQLPVLHMDATDKQIHEAVASLAAAGQSIESKRGELRAAAETLIPANVSGAVSSGNHEEQVQVASLQAKSDLAGVQSGLAAGSSHLVQQLLG